MIVNKYYELNFCDNIIFHSFWKRISWIFKNSFWHYEGKMSRIRQIRPFFARIIHKLSCLHWKQQTLRGKILCNKIWHWFESNKVFKGRDRKTLKVAIISLWLCFHHLWTDAFKNIKIGVEVKNDLTLL